MTPEELEQRLKDAFDEGYRAGYSRGDETRGEWERGVSKHDNSIMRDRESDWQDSDTRRELYPAE